MKITYVLINCKEQHMPKKYELTQETIYVSGRTLYRIRALKNFNGALKGSLGGFIEKEENLSQEGSAWVSGNALVYEDAQVSGDARVYGNVLVSENARVYGNAWVSGDALVYGNARVYGDAWVSGDARVYGNALVSGDTQVYGDARVSGFAQVSKKDNKDKFEYHMKRVEERHLLKKEN
jgi:cytoskeletal protein CcmA (bactofilin family)